MPKFTASSISSAKSLITQINTWIDAVSPYITTVRGDYRTRIQNEAIIIEGDNIGGTCPIAQFTISQGNVGLFNNSIDVSQELTSANGVLKQDMSPYEVSIVNSAFLQFQGWAENVIAYLSENITLLDERTNAFAFDFNTNTLCGVKPPATLTAQGRTLVSNAQNVLQQVTAPEASGEIPEPPTTVTDPISVPVNSAKKLFQLMDKLYTKVNNEHYVIITRVNQIKAIVSDLKEAILDNLAAIKLVQSNIFNNRTELKEARQGIKDLIGLGDTKFYPGSVSTIELMDRMDEIHQSENDALFEIRTRANQINNSLPDIVNQLTAIKAQLDRMETQTRDDYNNTVNYIFAVQKQSEDNLAALIEQARQEQYQYAVDIIQQINSVRNSVGQ